MRSGKFSVLSNNLLPLLALLALFPLGAWSERSSATAWSLLAVAYPDARDVEVVVGGSEHALTSRGLVKVKWRDGAATVEIAADQLPAPADLGKTGGQYVLWAVDQDKKVMNLGAVQLNGKRIKTSVQVPFRIFGLLLTVESDVQTRIPGTAVVLESRLPVNPDLVLPVFKIEVPLGS